jgi:hypothetical protein
MSDYHASRDRYLDGPGDRMLCAARLRLLPDAGRSDGRDERRSPANNDVARRHWQRLTCIFAALTGLSAAFPFARAASVLSIWPAVPWELQALLLSR